MDNVLAQAIVTGVTAVGSGLFGHWVTLLKTKKDFAAKLQEQQSEFINKVLERVDSLEKDVEELKAENVECAKKNKALEEEIKKLKNA